MPRHWHTWVIAAFVLAMYLGGLRDYLLLLTFTFRDRWEALGPMPAAFDIAITVVTAVLVYYCWRMRPRTVARRHH